MFYIKSFLRIKMENKMKYINLIGNTKCIYVVTLSFIILIANGMINVKKIFKTEKNYNFFFICDTLNKFINLTPQNSYTWRESKTGFTN